MRHWEEDDDFKKRDRNDGAKVSKKKTRRGSDDRFQCRARPRYHDQWHLFRARQPEVVQRRAADPWMVQASRHNAAMGVQACPASLALLNTDRADEHGICISCISPNHQFEKRKLCLNVDEREQCVVNLKVENTGTQPVYFISYIPPKLPKYFTLTNEFKVSKTNPLCLQPGEGYEIHVNFSRSVVGFCRVKLNFEFKRDLQTSTAFYIVHFIEIHCLSALGRELAPIAPFKPRLLLSRTPEVDYTIMDGRPPQRLPDMQLQSVVPLKTYPMPGYMDQLLKDLKQSTSGKRKAVLESALSWKKYAEKFHLLLYLEEQQMDVDIKRYNIPNNETKEAILDRDLVNRELLILKVPGVSENRPSVLRGDAVLVRPIGKNLVKYRGYVHSVQLDTLKLSFHSKLLDCIEDAMRFSVEFTVSRLTLRLAHRAADLADRCGLGGVLFPAVPTFTPQQTKLPELVLFDSKLKENPEQYKAVQHIVAGSSKPAPYLVFGPPGTGKTLTLVEAIKQLNKNLSSCHILACAPCNSAADLLCQKIVASVDKRLVFRMYANSCDANCVPGELKACSNLKGQCFVFPTKEKLMEYRIVVTTLFTAGRLVTGGIPEGHFTHIFVDEAGQATETECLIPLAGLLRAESGQVVLAGDPKQLGPIVRSPFALEYGMGVSLLERMMNHYANNLKNEDNSRFVIQLLHNYRSHPDILEFPSEKFYERKLKACANEVERNSLCGLEFLPTKGFPVIFHGVSGVNEREASSPSVFNRAEVLVLIDYIKKLLQTSNERGRATILPSDIGIIAPYRKQVQKIHQALDKVGKDLKIKDLSGLKVGSVEEFQGQERRVILVSTVRSHHAQGGFDEKFNLGFVKNDKRFNVAVTRAKALLIVVGNPSALAKDDTWSEFIKYCKDNGGFTQAEEDNVTHCL
ncbi:putative helicase mov-10-B.1 [Chelmon rostratus]|uniref:putative helicase mov-10-B.1 n=1 Tax=Chelmon rostratus TaxID=109905 RepID=UPI001BE6E10F|nr:putative helicase mov-10-B.1 [Chelmon rostratus]